MSFNLNVDETDMNSEMELLRSSDLWIANSEEAGSGSFQAQKSGTIRGMAQTGQRNVGPTVGGQEADSGSAAKARPPRSRK